MHPGGNKPKKYIEITSWAGRVTGFSHELVMYQKSHSLAALARSISDTNNEPRIHSR